MCAHISGYTGPRRPRDIVLRPPSASQDCRPASHLYGRLSGANAMSFLRWLEFNLEIDRQADTRIMIRLRHASPEFAAAVIEALAETASKRITQREKQRSERRLASLTQPAPPRAPYLQGFATQSLISEFRKQATTAAAPKPVYTVLAPAQGGRTLETKQMVIRAIAGTAGALGLSMLLTLVRRAWQNRPAPRAAAREATPVPATPGDRAYSDQ